MALYLWLHLLRLHLLSNPSQYTDEPSATARRYWICVGLKYSNPMSAYACVCMVIILSYNYWLPLPVSLLIVLT